MTEETEKSPPEKKPRKSSFVRTLILFLLVAMVGASVYFQPQIDALLSHKPAKPENKELVVEAPPSAPKPAAEPQESLTLPPPPPPVQEASVKPIAHEAETYKEATQRLVKEVDELKSARAELEKNLSQTQATLKEFEERLSIAEANAKAAPAVSAPVTVAGALPDASTIEPAAATPVPVADTVLQTKIAELETKLTELTAKQTSDIDLKTEVEALKTQVETRTREMEKMADQVSSDNKLSNAEQQEAWRNVSLLILYDRLKTSVLAGKPYEEEYNELENSITDIPDASGALEKLKSSQKNGIPDMTALKISFSKTINEALFIKTSNSDSIWDNFSGNLKSMVKVRKVGDRQGGDAEAVIARAETALKDNNLTLAIDELTKLEGPPKAAYASWIEAAKLRRDVPAVLDSLKSALVKPGEQTMFYER